MEKLNIVEIVESDNREILFDEKIAVLIEERYKYWNKRNCIFIHASPGLGKTYFILHVLYEYALQQGVEIAVFCNRSILKIQLWKENRTYDLEMNRRKGHLHLFLYQELEGSGEQVRQIKKCLERCRYIICDECHYFLTDATFNSGVQRSFDFITSLYKDSALIFMSATLEKVRPLIEQRIADYHEKYMMEREEYKEQYEASFLFDEDGNARCLTEIMSQNEINSQSLSYNETICFYDEQMQPVQIKEYQYNRDISCNYDVMYFLSKDELIDLIMDNKYSGKWMVFVDKKKTGKNLAEMLKGKDWGKVVYVDGEYADPASDDIWRTDARKEVKRIANTGKFKCDALITTTVLDNGVNVIDVRVKNIVLITDDEVEFKQMLGRRRFFDSTEKVNLFIWAGNKGFFLKRMKKYFSDYWKLCDNRDISSKQAFSLIKGKKLSFDLLNDCFDHEHLGFHANELAIEQIRNRYLYCKNVMEGLSGDEFFFLKEQLGWLGKEYTEEWVNNASISFTKKEIEDISSLLDCHYCSFGIIDKDKFADLVIKIMTVAEKIDYKKFGNKTGSITTVNNALEIREEWRSYKIETVGDRTKYYELLKDGKSANNIRSGMTVQMLEDIVNKNPLSEWRQVYELLFLSGVPETIRDDDEMIRVYINDKIKNCPDIKMKMLKRNNEKITVCDRPKSNCIH